MLRKLICLAAVGCLFLAIASVYFKQGDWDLMLQGGGNHGSDLDGVFAGVGVGLGYLLSDNFEVGVC